MIDNRKLAEDLSKKIDIQPSSDRILVKPLKPVMITKLLPVPPKQLANSIEDAENQEPTTPQKQRVEANIMKGIVLKLGTDYEKINGEDLKVGDVIFFHRQSGMPFELLKDSRLIRYYEVLGKQSSQNEN